MQDESDLRAAQEEQHAWSLTHLDDCIDGSLPFCDQLAEFIAKYPASAHVATARSAIEEGHRIAAEQTRAADHQSFDLLERVNQAMQQGRDESETAPQGPAHCCDGTPARCTGRGCCSHHGGVCR